LEGLRRAIDGPIGKLEGHRRAGARSAWRTLFAVMPVTVLHDRHESHRPEEKYKAPKRVRKRNQKRNPQLRTPLRGNVCVSTSDAQNSLRVREAPCKNLFVPDKPEYERIPVTTEVSKQTIFNCPLCLQPNKALKVQFNRTYQLCLVKGCPSGPGCMLSGTERVICEHVLTFCSTRGVCFCLQNCSSKYHGEAFCGQCTQLHSVGCLKAAPLGTENSDREQDRD
jgi:hypothetical protein